MAAAPENVVMNTVDVAGGVLTSSASASIPELLRIADGIWKEAKASTHGSSAECLSALQTAHEDFAKTFPLVLRWMVMPGTYNRGIFGGFLEKFKGETPKTKQDYLHLQCEYVVMLYRDSDPRNPPSAASVTDYREKLKKQIDEEDKEFQDRLETAKRIVEERKAAIVAEKRLVLKKALQNV